MIHLPRAGLYLESDCRHAEFAQLLIRSVEIFDVPIRPEAHTVVFPAPLDGDLLDVRHQAVEREPRLQLIGVLERSERPGLQDIADAFFRARRFCPRPTIC